MHIRFHLNSVSYVFPFYILAYFSPYVRKQINRNLATKINGMFLCKFFQMFDTVKE